MTNKTKPRKPSTFKGGHQHQNHVKMIACILGNAMAMQRQNDQNVASQVRVKAQ
jgi:hypothetical protein